MSPSELELLGRIRNEIPRIKSKNEFEALLNELWRLMEKARTHARYYHPQTSRPEITRTGELEERLHALEKMFSEKKAQQDYEQTELTQEITLDKLKGKDVLFGITPFGVDFDDVWYGAIKRAASSANLYPLRIDMLTKSSNITEDIIDAIKMSKVVVVDVTNNNPNVMFEFGYALALKKSPVVISQSIDLLPFDIQNIRTIPYQNTWKGIEKLHDELQKFLKAAHPKSKKT